MWMQCYSILLCGYLGGFGKPASGQLLTIEEVGGLMGGEFDGLLGMCGVFAKCWDSAGQPQRA